MHVFTACTCNMRYCRLVQAYIRSLYAFIVIELLSLSRSQTIFERLEPQGACRMPPAGSS